MLIDNTAKRLKHTEKTKLSEVQQVAQNFIWLWAWYMWMVTRYSNLSVNTEFVAQKPQNSVRLDIFYVYYKAGIDVSESRILFWKTCLCKLKCLLVSILSLYEGYQILQLETFFVYSSVWTKERRKICFQYHYSPGSDCCMSVLKYRTDQCLKADW